MVDDLEVLPTELKNSADLPMSTTFIKIRNDNTQDCNNFEEIKQDLTKHESNLVNFIDFEQFEGKDIDQFQRLLAQDTPEKALTYLGQHHKLSPYVNHINLKPSTVMNSGVSSQISTLKFDSQNTVEEEKVATQQPSSKSMTSDGQVSNDLSQGTWYRGDKCLAYSAILEEQYIKNVPFTSERHTREDIEALVKQGCIFDTNPEYLAYLLSQDNEQGS